MIELDPEGPVSKENNQPHKVVPVLFRTYLGTPGERNLKRKKEKMQAQASPSRLSPPLKRDFIRMQGSQTTNRKRLFLLALVPVLLLLPISLSVLAPLRGSCGVGRERTCGVVRATWCHGPGLILGQGDMKQQQQRVYVCDDSIISLTNDTSI
ncbi:hypothetical protein AVEN_8218-1 [Araneus ventricosus]|uniref:Uncharacterized protein n=1 Tax=Araneus ventricosus TaxID=182803 RepID=A0A4Y2VKA2_ARAVE|nr:hypothetical protein AVEN_8218-1 [Araneus ventricosus]